MSSTESKQILFDYVGGANVYIVLLDDEQSLLEITENMFQRFGFSTYSTTDPEKASEFIKKNQPFIAMVISDFKMPILDGFAFRKQVLNITPDIPFAILSGFIDKEMAIIGLELKISAFIDKPIQEEKIVTQIKNDLEKRLLAIHEERDLLKGFTEDAANLIEQAEDLVLGLEENPNDLDTISKIFGMIHTIKGSSGFFEPRTLHKYAHKFEDTLKEVQSGIRSLTPPLISVWLQACDFLKILISEFKTGNHLEYDLVELTKHFLSNIELPQTPINSRETPLIIESNQIAGSSKLKSAQELKVSVTLLDEFMQISGEMTVVRNMINKIVRSIEKQYPSDKDVALLSELLDELHKVNGSVQTKITEIRKVPVKTILKPLSRIVRDTSQSLKKEIELKVSGEEIRIDTSVAEVLSNSLIHLVRNSLDHGIELPLDRSQAGKRSRGELIINTKISGETIFVDIEDDGQGINPDAIRKKLLSNGSHTLEQINKLSVDELNQMIFSPGFSTASQITEISGRGVGMSMVKDVVEAIGGKILINSKLGKGTKFTLSIPIPKSVLITNCLFVTADNMQFGVPQDQIRRVINVEEANQKGTILTIEGANLLKVEEELIPIVCLKNILNGKFKQCSNDFNNGYLVVLSVNNCNFCLWVDEVLDVEDTVVKTITAGQIKNLGLYMGATFIGDGSIGLILNIEGLAQKTGVLKNNLYNSLNNKIIQNLDEKNKNTFALNVVLCEDEEQSQYAIPQSSIFRLEEFNCNQLQKNSSTVVAPYRSKMITFVDLQKYLLDPKDFSPTLKPDFNLSTVVIQYKSGFIGIVVSRIMDLVTTFTPPEMGIIQQTGRAGWLIINERPVIFINVDELLEELINEPKPITTHSMSA